MIQDFDQIKTQLKELAAIVNGFKSEAVQLRVVELVLAQTEQPSAPDDVPPPKAPRARTVTKKAGKAKAPKGSGKTTQKSKRKASGRPGPKTVLEQFRGDGYFKKPKTMGEIVEHAKHKMAHAYSTSDFSPTLGRAVRSGSLKRRKNADNQYEYYE